MKTTDKEDIVYIEAYKVVKQNLLNSLNHSEEEMDLAFGVGKKDYTDEMKYIKHLMGCNSTTKVLEEIINTTSNLNEMVYSFYMYVRFISKMNSEIQQFTSRFQVLPVEGEKELRELLKKLFDRRPNDNQT